MDITIASVAVVFIAPVLLLLYILIRLDMGSPVIFKQKRVGKNGKPFYMLKFRSMTDEKTPDGKLLPDKFRITTIGKLLRKTSLDELPQIFNIIKGEMSFIGPRPIIDYELEFLTEQEQRRHEVYPGITGLAQVSGRNNISNDTKFIKDVEYVENISFWLDLKIFLLTFPKVLACQDITVVNNTRLDLTRKNDDNKDKK
jgi:sugar transferase EpsL